MQSVWLALISCSLLNLNLLCFVSYLLRASQRFTLSLSFVKSVLLVQRKKHWKQHMHAFVCLRATLDHQLFSNENEGDANEKYQKLFGGRGKTWRS